MIFLSLEASGLSAEHNVSSGHLLFDLQGTGIQEKCMIPGTSGTRRLYRLVQS